MQFEGNTITLQHNCEKRNRNIDEWEKKRVKKRRKREEEQEDATKHMKEKKMKEFVWWDALNPNTFRSLLCAL